MDFFLARFFAKLIALTFALISCTNAFAQSRSEAQLKIDSKDIMTGVEDRSLVSGACARAANASVYAHSQGMLSNVLNESAKVRKLGASNDPFFNKLVNDYRLEPNEDFLFSALLVSQLTIMWLEEKSPYVAALEPIYTAYVAASCARVTKVVSP